MCKIVRWARIVSVSETRDHFAASCLVLLSLGTRNSLVLPQITTGKAGKAGTEAVVGGWVRGDVGSRLGVLDLRDCGSGNVQIIEDLGLRYILESSHKSE